MSDDELLQPSVPREPREKPPLPWRLQSQFWVAFFGGALPVAVVAIANARRLGVAQATRRWMIVASALAVIGVGVLWWLNPDALKFGQATEARRMVRIGSRVIAVALYLVLAAMQRRANARHSVFNGEYASLWKFGLMAVFVFGTLQTLTMAAIAWMRQ